MVIYYAFDLALIFLILTVLDFDNESQESFQKYLLFHLTVHLAEFECNMKRVKSNGRNKNSSYTKKYQAHIPFIFPYKVVCIDDRFSKPVALYRGKKMQSIDVLKQFLKSMIITKN